MHTATFDFIISFLLFIFLIIIILIYINHRRNSDYYKKFIKTISILNANIEKQNLILNKLSENLIRSIQSSNSMELQTHHDIDKDNAVELISDDTQSTFSFIDQSAQQSQDDNIIRNDNLIIIPVKAILKENEILLLEEKDDREIIYYLKYYNDSTKKFGELQLKEGFSINSPAVLKTIKYCFNVYGEMNKGAHLIKPGVCAWDQTEKTGKLLEKGEIKLY